MRNLNQHEQAAIEAVAKRFSATLEKSSDPADAYIKVAGKRVAVDVTTLKPRGAARSTGDANAKPRLRFDKVVIRLMERLQATVTETVPDGTTVVLTVTAPIRLPSKTAVSLEEKIASLLKRGPSPGRDAKATVHGNRVHIRLVRHVSARPPKLIGFVHNSDSDPLLLLNMTSELLQLFSAEAAGQAPKPACDRWLVVITPEGISCLEAYRYIYSQLHIATGFKKIVMVFARGRVEMLTQ
jgi:hypothetical protein